MSRGSKVRVTRGEYKNEIGYVTHAGRRMCTIHIPHRCVFVSLFTNDLEVVGQ